MLKLLGLGNYATQFYLHVLNRMAEEKWGTHATFPLELINVNFQDLNPFLPDQFEKLIPAISRIFNKYEDEKNEWFVPNITLFQTIDQLLSGTEFINCIHPVKETAKYLRERGIGEIYLFGSLYTMNATYVPCLLEKEGMLVSLPHHDDQLLIDALRKDVYKRGKQPETIVQWKDLLKKYKGCHLVIACTELSILAHETPSGLLTDMAMVQMNLARKWLEAAKQEG